MNSKGGELMKYKVTRTDLMRCSFPKDWRDCYVGWTLQDIADEAFRLGVRYECLKGAVSLIPYYKKYYGERISGFCTRVTRYNRDLVRLPHGKNALDAEIARLAGDLELKDRAAIETGTPEQVRKVASELEERAGTLRTLACFLKARALADEPGEGSEHVAVQLYQAN